MNSLQIADCVFTGAESIIDTHCHYNLEPFYPNWQPYWQKAQEHGVITSVIASTNQETSHRAVEISQQDEQLYALVGVHPSEAQADENLDWLKDLLQHPKVVGVGEVGLDYYWLEAEEKDEKIARQREVFRQQLEIAQQSGGWLSLHVRDRQEPSQPQSGNAYWDTYEMMRQFDWSNQPFILHCVSGSLEYVQAMLELGAYVGFDGNVTYPNAQHLRDILAIVPQDRLLIETDAPYLHPQSHRGQQCEPWMIAETAQFLAQKQ